MKHSLAALSLVLILGLIAPLPSQAVIEAVQFDSTAHEKRYNKLINELRCLVCQNQNLAGSDAPLAKDLREITASMIQSGSTDAEIKAFMRERYGDFVLYEPPFNSATAFLWLGPFIILLCVIIGIVITIKRRQHDELFKPAHANNESERIKVRNLMRNTPSLNNTPKDQ